MIQTSYGPKREAVVWSHNEGDKKEAGDDTRTMTLFIVSYSVQTALLNSFLTAITQWCLPILSPILQMRKM